MVVKSLKIFRLYIFDSVRSYVGLVDAVKLAKEWLKFGNSSDDKIDSFPFFFFF